MEKRLIESIRSQCEVVNASCADANLRRATRVVTHLYDQILAPSGLQITQFTLLVACALAGSVPITTLADALVMDRTTLARNLKPLEKRGMVKVTEGKDRRIRMVTLREKGYAALMQCLPLWQKAQTQIKEGFGETNLKGLLQDLSKIVKIAREA